MQCLFCGKTTKNHKFCSRSCSAKYNNSHRTLSAETKEKISSTFKNKPKQKLYRTCVVCGRVFEVNRRNDGRLSKTKVCSEDCRHALISENSKISVRNRILDGTFVGWTSRNVRSYPEKFWKFVLDNNKIPYKEEVRINGYFLDFLIEIGETKLDLEIDGKQHKYEERRISDIKRDIVLKKLGYVIYRIDWNEIKSDLGKLLMKNKIDKFLEYYAAVVQLVEC